MSLITYCVVLILFILYKWNYIIHSLLWLISFSTLRFWISLILSHAAIVQSHVCLGCFCFHLYYKQCYYKQVCRWVLVVHRQYLHVIKNFSWVWKWWVLKKCNHVFKSKNKSNCFSKMVRPTFSVPSSVCVCYIISLQIEAILIHLHILIP